MESAHVFEPARSKYLVITSDYLIPFFITIGIIFLFYLAILSPIFKVSAVSCSLDYGECSDPSVLAELEGLKGQNIFRLTGTELRKKLLSGDFTIREMTMKKSLPGSVSIDLQSVYPVVSLKVEGGSTWVVLDQKFRVIGTRDIDPNVPTVILPGPLTLTVGKIPDNQLFINTMQLALRLSSELVSMKSITLVDEDTVKIFLSSGVTAIFSPKIDEGKQLKSLQVVLSDATITKGVRTVDVRFVQPVLR